ncbi:MAG: hypothetical protein CVV42_09470 [Candidatus Riflebacteria bacterium HGW-Riflebacteria-2]|jgi:type II secretory pathway pseudopilin PulG|nr:MAG: hypothetical protein CVV42_09470 [Candidatus Riflebacteria bacterium HGW-Riflebacteria-2]
MRKSTAAMSMIEIMIGVILLALIIVPSLQVIVGQTRTVTATRDHSSAAFIAQKVQELCRSFQFDMIEADQYNSNPNMQKQTFEWKLKNDDEYRKHIVNDIVYNIDPEETSIEPIKGKHDGANTKLVALAFHFTINYKSKDQRDHQLKISTAITRRE